jgi:transcription elongation factor Elf1
VNTLNEGIQKKRQMVKFCPRCGSANIVHTGLPYYVFREHITCHLCKMYFEIQRDQHNDLPYNQEGE